MYLPYSPVHAGRMRVEADKAWKERDEDLWTLYFKVVHTRMGEDVKRRKAAGTWRPAST